MEYAITADYFLGLLLVVGMYIVVFAATHDYTGKHNHREDATEVPDVDERETPHDNDAPAREMATASMTIIEAPDE